MTENWDDLRIFLAVARYETLSAAGRHIKLDPATVGRRISRIEDLLGLSLFVRSTFGYALTDAGNRMLDHAARVEQAMLGLTEEISGQTNSLSGQIRIGAPDGCANFLLPQVCARILDQNPNLDIQIVALPRVINLTKREADIAIAVSPPATGRLTAQKLTDYKLHLAASEEYLRDKPPLIELSDVKGHRFIGYIADMIFDKELDYLTDLGVQRLPLASNSVAVQFNWLRAGAGLGVVHDFALPFAPVLKRVLTDEFSLTRSFYLIRHYEDRRMDRMNKFVEALAKEIRVELDHLERSS